MSRGYDRLIETSPADSSTAAAPAGTSPRRKRNRRIAAVAAPVATMAAIGIGVMATPSADVLSDIASPSAASADNSAALARAAGANALSRTAVSSAERTARVSRDFVRAAIPEVSGKLWTTRDLKLRLTPTENAKDAGDIESIKQVPVTGTTRGDYTQVVLDKKVYWVTSEYLSKDKPEPTPETMGVSTAACPHSASGGLQPSAQRVLNAVCAAFPQITSYGGQANRGEHVGGKAIDVMVSGALGYQVRDFLFAHRYELNLFDIIYSKQIWTIQRDGEGFRGMSDRGSATANHYDHVHVLVN